MESNALHPHRVEVIKNSAGQRMVESMRAIINKMDPGLHRSPSTQAKLKCHRRLNSSPKSASKSITTADPYEFPEITLWNFEEYMDGEWTEIKQLVIAAESAVEKNEQALEKLKQAIVQAKSTTTYSQIPYTQPCAHFELKELSMLLDSIKIEEIDHNERSYGELLRNLQQLHVEESTIEQDGQQTHDLVQERPLRKKQSIRDKVVSNGLEAFRQLLAQLGFNHQQ